MLDAAVVALLVVTTELVKQRETVLLLANPISWFCSSATYAQLLSVKCDTFVCLFIDSCVCSFFICVLRYCCVLLWSFSLKTA